MKDKALEIVLKELAEPLILKTVDNSHISTNVFWIYRKHSEAIDLLYKSKDEKSGIVNIDLTEQEANLVIDYMTKSKSNSHCSNDEKYSNECLTLMIFADKYLLNNMYKNLDKHILPHRLGYEWPFLIRRRRLPIGESYKESIRRIKRNIYEISRELRDLSNEYKDVAHLVFTDICLVAT